MDKQRLAGIVNEIKRSFRVYMDGVTAKSLRDKGLPYHLIWGCSLMHLRELAAEYEKDVDLACALWGENIRECKLLAVMLMPEDGFGEPTARRWAASLAAQETAEVAAKLYAKQPWAETLAAEIAKSDDALRRILAFNVYSLRMADGLADEGAYTEAAAGALTSKSVAVRHAAYNSLMRFADKGGEAAETARLLLNAAGMGDCL